jgi:hypothetical protein
MLSTPVQLTQVEISPQTSGIAVGETVQFKATGVYSDGHSVDLTSTVSWSGSPQSVLDVSASGLATGRQLGTATINARSGSINGTGTLTVSAARLISIEVAAGKTTMPLGTAQQIIATGTYTDHSASALTNSASWSSGADHIISITSHGLADAKAQGAAIITAMEHGVSGSVSLTVSPAALAGILISPHNPTIPLTSSLQLTTLGSFTDGSTQDLTKSVTWDVDNNSILGLSSTGNATGHKVGSATVNAAFHGILGSTTVIVEPLISTSYFTNNSDGVDSSLRITNPGDDEQKLCAMVYVFDQGHQMAECCGCLISWNGLRTLSLKKDVADNPLTGTHLVAGTIVLATADYVDNPSCNPSSMTPTGMARSWITHLQAAGLKANALTEEPLSQSPLNPTLSSNLQAQCSFIQQLSSGQGRCSCGTSH